MIYNHQKIEKKWRDYWDAKKLFVTAARPARKFYNLEMYAYPSGDIHMGQGKNYVIGDVYARFKIRQGYDILHPWGWDAFGLPAENKAIELGIHPEKWTMENIAISDNSLKLLGISYDWEREIITCKPDYYKWTQWMFLLLYKRGLACKKESYVNWCPGCQTVLANEQVEQGKCYRCDALIEKKKLNQWYFRITQYAERLLGDIDKLFGWTENVKLIQRNWIGKSKGCDVKFKVAGNGMTLNVFTTRPDTIFGVTFMSIAPEHPVVEDLIRHSNVADAVRAYIKEATKKSEIERIGKEKDGVFTGAYAINPCNAEKIPIFVADYVLSEYGSGVVMGVPAHDERDFQFARKYKLPIRVVIDEPGKKLNGETMEHAYEQPGIMVNSGQFNGLDSIKGIDSVTDFLAQKAMGGPSINYRLKDWLVSRQRYWGAPIPIIHCDKCGMVPVPEKDLPVLLPKNITDFVPKGKSPLAAVPDFINTKCPQCGAAAKRDPDTMDTFVCSSWYFLRYLDPKNNKEFCKRENADTWLPIDQYIGGSSEHAIGHLIYFRFFTKVLYDAGYIGVDEPALKLFNLGMVLKGGVKMSKSKGNAVPIGDFVKKHGADVARLTIVFAAPPEREMEWSEEGVVGAERFLDRIYRIVIDNKALVAERVSALEKLTEKDKSLYIKINQTIARLTEDLEQFKFNTGVAALWELLNQFYITEEKTEVFGYGLYVLVNLLSPFAPHLADELWTQLGREGSLTKRAWLAFDKNYLRGDTVTVVVQLNGKVRSHIQIDVGTSEKEVVEMALNDERVKRHIGDKTIRKTIYIKEKILNIVV